jgi:hypothetical protein
MSNIVVAISSLLALIGAISITHQDNSVLLAQMGWEELEADEAHKPGWNGTFDNRVVLTNGQGESGAIYVGNLFINESPLRLIFDTGSDYLAITSSLCSDKRFDEEAGPAFDAAERAGSGGDSSAGGVGGNAAGAPAASSNVQLSDEEPKRCDS